MKTGKVFDIKTGDEKIITESGRGFIVKQKNQHCYHDQCIIDVDQRTVCCAQCEALLDPFEYLLQAGRKEHAAFLQKDWINKERNRLSEEADKLKKEISYLKSQKKKLNP